MVNFNFSSYFFSKDGLFDFELLNNIDQYPGSNHFKKYDDFTVAWLSECKSLDH